MGDLRLEYLQYLRENEQNQFTKIFQSENFGDDYLQTISQISMKNDLQKATKDQRPFQQQIEEKIDKFNKEGNGYQQVEDKKLIFLDHMITHQIMDIKQLSKKLVPLRKSNVKIEPESPKVRKQILLNDSEQLDQVRYPPPSFPMSRFLGEKK